MKSSWFKSHRQNSAQGQIIRQDVYDRGQNALIAYLLGLYPPVVASLEAVPGEVVAWVCREHPAQIVHYVYVKHPFRRTGIGSLLVRGSQYHSHQTRAGELLFRKVGSLYNPFLLGVSHATH